MAASLLRSCAPSVLELACAVACVRGLLERLFRELQSRGPDPVALYCMHCSSGRGRRTIDWACLTRDPFPSVSPTLTAMQCAGLATLLLRVCLPRLASLCPWLAWPFVELQKTRPTQHQHPYPSWRARLVMWAGCLKQMQGTGMRILASRAMMRLWLLREPSFLPFSLCVSFFLTEDLIPWQWQTLCGEQMFINYSSPLCCRPVSMKALATPAPGSTARERLLTTLAARPPCPSPKALRLQSPHPEKTAGRLPLVLLGVPGAVHVHQSRASTFFSTDIHISKCQSLHAIYVQPDPQIRTIHSSCWCLRCSF